jgi:hypothetical protein
LGFQPSTRSRSSQSCRYPACLTNHLLRRRIWSCLLRYARSASSPYLPGYASGGLGRKPCSEDHLRPLATKLGEKCRLRPSCLPQAASRGAQSKGATLSQQKRLVRLSLFGCAVRVGRRCAVACTAADRADDAGLAVAPPDEMRRTVRDAPPITAPPGIVGAAWSAGEAATASERVTGCVNGTRPVY